jgi:hypothetical protein
MKELGFGLQADWQPTKPKLDFSFADGSLRYNRIEGLSAGASAWPTANRTSSWAARAPMAARRSGSMCTAA